ncbi:nickel-dependent hydrogenase, large subunit [Magnetococcus marinus MC-1]|uniref:Nickel-dependent hydrogenase, large subunit n=2 Tax=Magnetococcus TaxID=162171 RepID=A0L610_MAGMM|nr:nickel-dependent hydrogenase, large subunit [Magnetococcus marinus MC-1]
METITIDHLYRVEGHGGITVAVNEEGIQSCQMSIFEGARFYELLLKGKLARDAPGIVCRVCSICSAGHTLASVMALESALGIHVSDTVQGFRTLLNLGQFIESHALHLFALAAPDYLGNASILQMASHFPEQVQKGLEIKRVGNLVQEVVGGRAIHPVNVIVGGLGRRPARQAMQTLLQDLQNALDLALSLRGFVASLQNPEMGLQPPILVALRASGARYGLTGTHLAASGHEDIPVAHFYQRVNEKVVRHSTAKQSTYAKKPFMVGALARMVHNGERLTGEAAQLREALLPAQPTTLHNNAAQFVELVWALEEAVALCEALQEGPALIPPMTTMGFEGEQMGLAALEVPRGTLYHLYGVNGEGVLTQADIITPTAQNLAHVERDFAHGVGYWLEQPQRQQEQLRLYLEMIARAYDPCISCSTHLVDLTVQV